MGYTIGNRITFEGNKNDIKTVLDMAKNKESVFNTNYKYKDEDGEEITNPAFEFFVEGDEIFFETKRRVSTSLYNEIFRIIIEDKKLDIDMQISYAERDLEGEEQGFSCYEDKEVQIFETDPDWSFGEEVWKNGADREKEMEKRRKDEEKKNKKED